MHQEIRRAPAKINLTLNVLGKRADGFHELESLIASLDLCDLLHFKKSDMFSLSCETHDIPLDETNLITRAVRLFEREMSRACSWRIILEKKIPHGAGMGGGSSDAATTLLALNDLEDAGFSSGKLARLAAEIGSDVPFFIYQQSCMIRGRGELVEPISVEGLAGTQILLMKPNFGVSTPDAYKNCLNAESIDGIDYAAQNLPWGKIINDLEKPVFYKHRFLAEMKVWLLAQPEVEAAMMSGSGSTMIAFLDHQHADAVIKRAHIELDPSLWVCKANIL